MKEFNGIMQSPIRKNSIYYSDQLEIICETEVLSVSWFTSNIAVIQEWFEGIVIREFEVFMFGEEHENEQRLKNIFEQAIAVRTH